jgi:hypothetical protein
VPVHRPRVRGQGGDVKIGSYDELFRRDEERQKRIWEAITRGLSTRGYGSAVRESEKAFAIEKSAVSEQFVAMSAPEGERTSQKGICRNCACVFCCGMVWRSSSNSWRRRWAAMKRGAKRSSGFIKAPVKNQTACDGLFSNLAARGLDFRQLHLNIIDGSKTLRAGVRKQCGERSPILRCQLTLHRLKVLWSFGRRYAAPNVIESAFSIVRVVCRNVKRWRAGSQIECWSFWAHRRREAVPSQRWIPRIARSSHCTRSRSQAGQDDRSCRL